MKKGILIILSAIFAIGTQAQVIHTIAGTGSPAFGGDGAQATAAALNTPYGVAVDGTGSVYVADYGNHRIRKIDVAGNITTIAGTGTGTYSGDGGPATAADIQNPRGIAVDGAGNVYFSDYGNNRVRKITPAGYISTIAGIGGVPAFSGDGGPATAAQLGFTWGIAVDASGSNIYLADQMNCRVRKINSAGIISTIAGTGSCFISGDGGPAIAARLQYPVGVALDGAGNLYIADNGNNLVRKINTSGIITSVAGSAVYGFSGDGGPSTAAQLYYPQGIAADATGNVYICDLNNNRIRKINTAGIISTIVGTGVAAFSGDGGPPVLAKINQSTGVAVDAAGKIYIADNNNNRVRLIHVVTHGPLFIGGHTQVVTPCPADLLNIDTLLAINDVDTGQTETWTVLSGAYHGTVSAAYTATSTGGLIYPSGLTYTRATGYTGSDTFTVRVTDGTYSDTTTVYINFIPSPDPGTIVGQDTLCIGMPVTFTDTASGGTWSSSDNTVCTISTTGIVTPIDTGHCVIAYTVSNSCDTQSAFFPTYVRLGTDCPTGVRANAGKATGIIDIFPNPNTGTVHVKISSAFNEEVNVVISNVVGTTVTEFKTMANRENIVKLSLPPGNYIISATSAHGTWREKMTVAR